MQWASSTKSNEWISLRVTSYFYNEQLLLRVTSQNNEQFLEGATCAISNERILQRVLNDFFQRATSASSNEWLFTTRDFCND